MARLKEVLNGQEANYLLPFFWQRGEDEQTLREEMARIHESGIRAVCVEARPHPDYLGPKWWSDMDVILDEARRRGMQVWILDDEHFPTGSAAGKLKEAPGELRRLFLQERHVDAYGPDPHAAFIIEAPVPPMALSMMGLGTAETFAVIACKRDPKTGLLTGEAVDLTDHVADGMLHWAVPEGYWRIFILDVTDKGGSKQQEDYLNPLVAASTRVLIDTVYEAFYARYKDEFGKTIVGFFSDEPGFYNDKDAYDFHSLPGKIGVALPWSPDVPERLKEELGTDYRLQLPLLWHDQAGHPPAIRYHYMNIVSRLYGENFTRQIGDWCRERGVAYIGHVIEDNNAHARLGAGPGHFYRAQDGQDMAGIDVVLWQLAPGYDEIPFKWLAGEADSEFFHYGLAKMASSLAHHDPKKKGRTMAEVFGAYGWVEGLKLMKWLTDHMLVRGVNHFVPHAFSAKEFPDPDCPPHLYARGKNPQYRYYRYLNQYTNRLSHLLSGGTHVASAAVLYHAEAEWSGTAMYFHKPVKELMRRQIDCDVLPIDLIVSDSVKVVEGRLIVKDERFDCLIVPFSEALPRACLEALVSWAEQRLDVIFVNGLPTRSSEGFDVLDMLERLAALDRVSVVRLEELAEHLIARGHVEIRAEGHHPYLRYYHVRREDEDVYLFFNEHPRASIDTVVKVPAAGRVWLYDAYENRIVRVIEGEEGGITRIPLSLAPFETIVAVIGGMTEGIDGEVPAAGMPEGQWEITGPWSLSLATSEQYPEMKFYGTLDELVDLSKPDRLPRFSGTFRYEATVSWHDELPKQVFLDLGAVYETAEVFVNGRSAGVRISHPYRFDLSSMLVRGDNTLAIEVTNTLVKEQRDMFSLVAQQEPSGLLGPVKLLFSSGSCRS
jgi:Glycosyl hydrolases family 2, sugar binding domain.